MIDPHHEPAEAEPAPLPPAAAAALGEEELSVEEFEPAIQPLDDAAEALRRAAAQRIEELPLSPAARERLRSLLPAATPQEASLLVPLEAALELFGSALPAALLHGAEQALVAEHPAGSGYFTAGAGELSDEEARRIAAEQLAGSGYERRP